MRGLVESAPRGIVHAVAAGNYRSARVARQARAKAGACLDQYWVLPAKSLGEEGGYTLAVLTTREDLAAALAEKTRSCAQSLKVLKMPLE